MKIEDLTNEEILLIHFSSKLNHRNIESAISRGGLIKPLNVLGVGGIMRIDQFIGLSEQEIEEIKNSEVCQAYQTLNEKILPIVKVIEETNPDLYNKFKL